MASSGQWRVPGWARNFCPACSNGEIFIGCALNSRVDPSLFDVVLRNGLVVDGSWNDGASERHAARHTRRYGVAEELTQAHAEVDDMSKSTKGSDHGNGDSSQRPPRLRSRSWFDDPAHPDMSALYLERYTNFGLSIAELQSDRPIIGIAQTGSDLAPCNRHHLVLAQRVKEGIRDAGGIPIEFPVHPIQETGKRPTAGLDRNLAYLGLVELLFGYPLDGVVLTTGCDKTTPASLMAAATVNIPAIALPVGPMLNGWHDGQRVGSGTIVWEARQLLATGRLARKEYIARGLRY